MIKCEETSVWAICNKSDLAASPALNAVQFPSPLVLLDASTSFSRRGNFSIERSSVFGESFETLRSAGRSNQRSWFRVLFNLVACVHLVVDSVGGSPPPGTQSIELAHKKEYLLWIGRTSLGLGKHVNLVSRRKMMKTLNKTFLLLTAGALVCTGASFAHAQQLEIEPTSDAQVLRDALVGASSKDAIEVTAATYTGALEAAGTYTNGPQSLADGVLLTTGKALLALPPNNENSAGFNNELEGSELCSGLTAPHPSLDVAHLSLVFTLKAPFTGISFQSIFGSEEFPEYVGREFNDAYGVFLDGKQVAFDDRGAPITINGPFFRSESVVTETQTQYDGSTSILTTRASAEPGEHTLEIVICDAGDRDLDSGVFLTNLNGCIGEDCDSTVPCELVDNDRDGVDSCTDCNDGDVSIYPGAAEICDDIDNNCDGQIDEAPDCCPDMDADGVCDEDDACPGADDGADTDGDLVPDACDNCPNTSNAGQEDEDKDGLGDACQGLPTCEDRDQDGVRNQVDECRHSPPGEAVNEQGCTVDQLCPCSSMWLGAQMYQGCVSEMAEEFSAAGWISSQRKDLLIKAAQEADCGDRRGSVWNWWIERLRSSGHWK